MVWKRTISAKILEKVKSAPVKVEDKVIFMANINGTLYAIDGACTHARCIIHILDEQNLTVRCPCHQALFDLKTGKMLEPPFVAPDAPKEKLGLKTYQIRDNNGWIEVDV
ncbi:sulredoxin [Acidianus manzaensis]|uniref:Sulredoxin n=1 Tax=Acidianus manzaensis TaxID=282676 RepID=A0A1W6K2A1_9CREN|nr:sulredoxin [Acidianus manzaensis]ARM76617.1 sulredoxin [Acidianus manzaensis]